MTKRFFDQKALALSFICAMVLVAVEVSPWMAFFALGLVMWKWGVENLNWRPLSRRVTGILSVVILGQVLFQYRTLIGQEPSYTFLLGLSGLRIMDYSNDRDHKFIVLLGFVLISIKALFSLDIYWIVPSGLAFAGLWFALLPETLPQRGKILAKVFLLSIPGALILFFAFPRIVLPWAMSRGSGYGQIGFSDELNPGRVAELAATTNVAFRAKISELPLKSTHDMYWRGSVLTQSKGLSWRPGRMTLADAPQKFRGLNYEVALEPQAALFLFTLDGTQAVQLEAGTVLPLQASVFRASRPLMATTAYRAAWSTRPDTEVPDETFLEIPDLSKRITEWVEKTKKENATPQQRAQALKGFYTEHDFIYTLSPGTYSGVNDLEAFLFHRKRGFCEHFAGSYATLARALGIPARVVIGYQGGRYNPLGDFWKISQRDAHAWVEIYLNDVWERVDPTAWVAPLRLAIGADEFFNLSEEDQQAFARNIQWRPDSVGTSMIWDRVTFLVEDLNYRWTYFLLDFDRGAQQSFWRQLADAKLQIAIGLICILVLCLMIFRSLFRGKALRSEEQYLLSQISHWGRTHHSPPHLDEPPLHYLARLGREFPQVTTVLKDISMYYDQKIYAEISQPKARISQLMKEWKEASKK